MVLSRTSNRTEDILQYTEDPQLCFYPSIHYSRTDVYIFSPQRTHLCIHLSLVVTLQGLCLLRHLFSVKTNIR